MTLISMIISFIVYPFYSSATTLKDIIKDKRLRVDIESMQDNLYVMNFFMVFGRYLIFVVSLLLCVVATYLAKNSLENPLTSILVGIAMFIISYWISSIVVFSVQVISWMSTTMRKMSKDLEQMSKKTDTESKKMVH